ncbi:hypothetical protein CBF90_14425 [Microbacterium sp. AISO3]|nr:hypothetical protein CBF90_17960 [Microbacterium sp. AISO3]OWP20909.1 hypothetical protein CBF90_14425 [Microbacterium sp. AISO3]
MVRSSGSISMQSASSDLLPGAVTVIAPVKNAASYVPGLVSQLIGSLRDQDRVIFIDDSSDDDTLSLLTEHVAADPRFSILEESESRGVAHARNRAVAQTRTEFVWFVDHDDEWLPQAISHMVSRIGQADILLARADYRTDPLVPGRIVDGIDSDQELTARDALQLVLKGKIHGYLWCKLFRTEILGSDPFPLLSSQSDFCGVVAMLGRARRVRMIPTIVYHYLWRPGSITRKKRIEFGNFAAARSVVHETVASFGAAEASVLRLTEFDCRFYVHALAFVPIRQGASPEVRKQGYALARQGLRGVRTRELLSTDSRLFLEMTLIRLGPVAYTAVTVAALRLFDFRNRLRVASSRRVS